MSPHSPVNPFSVTKADDFSDDEIKLFWQDMTGSGGFSSVVNPTSLMPMYLLGGKGSGKTHLLRYFSSTVQDMGYGDTAATAATPAKFFGIYIRCSGLNAGRFKGKGVSQGVWMDVFAYYMELWLTQICLHAIHGGAHRRGVTNEELEGIGEHIHQMLPTPLSSPANAFAAALKGLTERQHVVDRIVNNASVDTMSSLHVDVTRGQLIFGIPQYLERNVKHFEGCVFLYLFDEFENLDWDQQIYINTLLRERQRPCSFRIGSRAYGVKTHATLSAGEENKPGSEYEEVRLDDRLRKNRRKYSRFVTDMISKRLSEAALAPTHDILRPRAADSLSSFFEETSDPEAPLCRTVDRHGPARRPWFRRLAQHHETAFEGEADRLTANAITYLSAAERPLLEKVNIFLYYREWSRTRPTPTALEEAAKRIGGKCKKFVKGELGPEDKYRDVIAHFKADLIAQALRQCDQKQRYDGLETFIEMSWGLPRNLLVLLKSVYSWSLFYGEQPLKSGLISTRAQQAGVADATEWFFNDARMVGGDGQFVQAAIDRLGQLFKAVRFSDKPSECSCTAFSCDLAGVSDDARRYIDIALKWSLLIRVGVQRDRNTLRLDAKFQLNRMLAPRYDLAIYRRGVLALSADEVDGIFSPSCVHKFDKLCQLRVERMTAPYFGQSSNGSSNPTLPGF